jgi:ABC-type multidrug transport system ATPase subunit
MDSTPPDARALLPLLTGREQLQLYASLRGVPRLPHTRAQSFH